MLVESVLKQCEYPSSGQIVEEQVRDNRAAL